MYNINYFFQSLADHDDIFMNSVSIYYYDNIAGNHKFQNDVLTKMAMFWNKYPINAWMKNRTFHLLNRNVILAPYAPHSHPVYVKLQKAVHMALWYDLKIVKMYPLY